KDVNYTTISGRGVYVGDVLSVVNSVPAWWGEGDEKIYVDGETFPSHFGTGTEDYYGYAWCTPQFFEDPFHAQPRAEGPGNFGNTTNLRFRALDAIPFEKDFRFDMEVWHWEATTIDYAVATFWYGAPGAELVDAPDRGDMEDEVMEPVEYKRVFKQDFPGFEYRENPSGGNVSVQKMADFAKNGFKWVDDRQLWWTGAPAGSCLTLNVKDIPSGATKLVMGATVAKDYGVAQFCWNGQKIGKPVDFFNAPNVERRLVKLPIPKSDAKEGVLTIEIVGKNEKSEGTLFGVDSITFE
ncbi:MAG: DUF2961 domain-containing protein, partial [Thermoguttaceae bacterium]|nr:DUF2961 domain-containing protein [Thermoguttaceae bacterium]